MKRIYVADDEADIHQLIQSFLSAEGYKVACFTSGDALLEAFEAQPADLLVLDIMMPGLDGLSLCAAIRKRSDVPIIMLTARDTDADFITGFTVGCDDYFTKPFSMLTQPQLTAVEADMFNMGQEAARFILRKIRMPELQTLSYCTILRVIERKST